MASSAWSNPFAFGTVAPETRAPLGFLMALTFVNWFGFAAWMVLLNNFTCATDAAKSAVDNFAQHLAHAATDPK